MAKQTKAQIEAYAAELQQQLLAEREARNADVRRLNARAFEDAQSVATAYADARSHAEGRREAEARAHRLSEEASELRADLLEAQLRRTIAEQQTEITALKRLREADSLRAENDRLRLHNVQLQAELRDRPSIIALDTAAPVALEHQAYGGDWAVNGFHYQADQGQLEIRLHRANKTNP